MKITVLNGSPKGDKSITLHYVKFIEKNFPMHEMEIINISAKIKVIEKDGSVFNEIIEKIQKSELIIWAYPLYFLLVAAQYKRFIELVFERNATNAFSGKYSAIISTSIHFFDNTAENYMEGISNDLGLNHIASFTPAMYDLLQKDTQNSLIQYAKNIFDVVEKKYLPYKKYKAIKHETFEYVPGNIAALKIESNKKILIVADSTDKKTNIGKMIIQLNKAIGNKAEILDISAIDIKGSCLGCIQCGWDNTCAYTGKDDLINIYETKMRSADIIVYAGAIHDRFFSAKWKQFIDRKFYKTHTPIFIKKQILLLVSGPYSQIPNIHDVFSGMFQFEKANLAGVATDESVNNGEIDNQIISIADTALRFSESGYVKPRNSLGQGGINIFRDEIFGELRFPFRADYKFYKKNNFFDFPQKKIRARLINAFLTTICLFPPIRKKVYKTQIIDKMIEPFKKLKY